jgi:hypothetical protein
VLAATIESRRSEQSAWSPLKSFAPRSLELLSRESRTIDGARRWGDR